MAKFHQGTKDGVTGALACFYEAIRLDPEFASAYGMAAWCHFWRKLNRWMTNPSQELKEGAQLARRALELGKDDAVALTRAGHALGHFGGDLESCIDLVDKARVLNPNLSAAWYLGAFQRLSRGEPDAALEYFERAMRLSPLDPETFRMQAGKALAHMLAGRFDAASSCAEKAFRELPTFLLVPAIIAASHALAGRMDEAGRAMQHLRALDPTLCSSNLKDWILLRPEDVAVFAKGLRMAGLPE
jgi:tetratricopeptide (TPR) repeat protein